MNWAQNYFPNLRMKSVLKDGVWFCMYCGFRCSSPCSVSHWINCTWQFSSVRGREERCVTVRSCVPQLPTVSLKLPRVSGRPHLGSNRCTGTNPCLILWWDHWFTSLNTEWDVACLALSRGPCGRDGPRWSVLACRWSAPHCHRRHRWHEPL